MVAPVTGPFVTEIGGSTDETVNYYYSYKSGYKQAKPHTLTTAYRRRLGTVISKTASCTRGARYVGAYPCTIPLVSDSVWNQTISQCYERFRSKTSDRSSLGVTLLELDQSMAMIAKRSIELFRFGRRLVRGDLLGAARELRLAVVPKGASARKSFANNYLEYHFGWSPLVGDIYSSIDVLQSPLKDFHVRAGSKAPDQYMAIQPLRIVRSGASYPFPFYAEDEEWRRLSSIGVKMGAEVGVTNPNLWLANQLGLINPAVLVYEKIPFSFIADWFFNVEQFLSQSTDFYGLSMKNAWTTRHAKSFVHYHHLQLYQNGSGVLLDWATVNDRCTGGSLEIDRAEGLTLPSFGLRPFKVFGLRRSLAAVSLVTQQLKGR